MIELFQQYQNYFIVTAIVLLAFILIKQYRTIYEPIEALVQFILKAHTETDGNGGKPSYSRIMGTVVIANIIRMALLEKEIPEQLMTMFWVLVGYQLVSKIVKDNPALMEFIKGKYGIAAPANTTTTATTTVERKTVTE